MDVTCTFSYCAEIRCGVRQGSILAPMLLLIYVNGMSGAVVNMLQLYADEFAKFVADNVISTIETLLQ